MKKCILCNTELNIEALQRMEEVGDELYTKSYCTDQCMRTDEMVLRADCEDDNDSI
jgi:hypothetical protein